MGNKVEFGGKGGEEGIGGWMLGRFWALNSDERKEMEVIYPFLSVFKE